MTVEEYNARERRRGSIVAKLHGYIPLEVRRHRGSPDG